MPTLSPPRRRVRPTGSATSTVFIVLVLVGVAVAAYLAAGKASDVQGVTQNRALKSLGLGNPVTNKLDPAFADADGDLVADTPEQTRTPETLKFCYLSEAAGVTGEQLETLRQHLADAVGVPVEYVALPDTKAQLRALGAGELDITGFNTGTVPLAVNAVGFVPVAAPSTQGQAAVYRMVFIAPAGSALEKPEDLAGGTITLTHWGSNSGFKAPLVLLKEQFGMLPERDYTWSFSMSHAKSIAGVADGSVAVAATASDLLQTAVDNEEIATSDYKVIYESEAFPVAALGVAHDLDPALAEKIKAALLSYDPSGAAASATALAGADAMTAVNFKDDFSLVRRIDDAAGFKHKLPTDETDAPSEEGEAAQPTTVVD